MNLLKKTKKLKTMSKINWKRLRENYFNECVEQNARGMKRVVIAPHDLFEWFKAEIEEDLKSK